MGKILLHSWKKFLFAAVNLEVPGLNPSSHESESVMTAASYSFKAFRVDLSVVDFLSEAIWLLTLFALVEVALSAILARPWMLALLLPRSAKSILSHKSLNWVWAHVWENKSALVAGIWLRQRETRRTGRDLR
ncbi:hypothetical protein TIFTF001_013160 [Ficus carica]|uniref:Uncharacterized protein n=1 Tax=Ficus carica TaxID=3494 RepID=A0AA88APG4_FICCA|nr:hypothetical protein TIFTF001_013160 [Ficus carica]